MSAKVNLLNLSELELKAFVVSLNEPAFRVQQLVQWIHQRGIVDFSQMTNLSQSLRKKLTDTAEILAPEIILENIAKDGTAKWLLRLFDGNAIEMVYIPETNRGTLCVSSQVGCALNCSFCATGKAGFNRNLTLAEIIGQVWIAVHRVMQKNIGKVTNVVLMGMGEPLLNYEPVISALHYMLSDLAYGLSKYRVTLSTSGVIPMMEKLRKDSPVALAVSLHAPNDTLRNQLVPLNKKYPLRQLMDMCRRYFGQASRRSITFEYVMLAGVNDSLEEAKQLVRLLHSIRCKVNLIPFNIFPGTPYLRSSDATISAFQQYLLRAKINTWVRKTRGDDIAGACGQLAGDFNDRTGRNARWLRVITENQK